MERTGDFDLEPESEADSEWVQIHPGGNCSYNCRAHETDRVARRRVPLRLGRIVLRMRGVVGDYVNLSRMRFGSTLLDVVSA